jgi:hypothetical protein
MSELVRQLDKAAAEIPRGRVELPHHDLPPAKKSEGGERRDPVMLFAVGLILGCIFCGVILLVLASGSNPPGRRAATHAATDPSAAAANSNQSANSAHANSNSGSQGAAQKTESSSNSASKSSSSRAGSRKSNNRSKNGDSSRYGRAYVVSTPGKPPRMYEPQ